MSKESVLNKVTVKIKYKGRIGSGSIYNIAGAKYTYIFTAKHCLASDENEVGEKIEIESINKDDIDINSIEISKHIGRKKWDNSFKVVDVFLAEEDIDLAVILIEKLELDVSISIMKPEGLERYDVVIYGYPKRLENSPLPKQLLDARLNIVYEYDQIELEIKNLDTFEAGAKEFLNSLSGAPIFREVDNELYLIGIYTQVKDIQVAYGALLGESIIGISDIINNNFLEKFNIEYSEKQVNSNGKYVTLKEWEFINKVNLSPWVELESSIEIINQVHNHFDSWQKENILYIIGESGSGKTRSVLEACKLKDEYKKVMYFEKYENMDDKFFNNIKEDRVNKFYIVIDDVSANEWEKINILIEGYSNIRIIAIGVIGKNRGICSNGLIYKQAPSKEEIKLLLKRNNESLNDENIDKIISLSESDLRLVLLIKDIFMRDRNISFSEIQNINNKYTSLKSIYERILMQYKYELGDIESFKKIYAKLCILIDIGYKGKYRHELEIIQEYFNLSNGELDSVIHKATQSCLGKCKYEFFEPYPRVLAKYIFENESWPLIKQNIPNFMNNLTEIMKKRFINRVEECDYVIKKEVDEALATWFQIEFSSYNLEFILDSNKAKTFSVYTEFQPIEGLKWLLNSLKVYSNLKLFVGRPRRYVIWLVEHLACFKEYFYLCEEILFILAQYESESISNNSIGVWSGLYLISLSNTEISFRERYKLYFKRLEEVDIDSSDFVINVISSIFNDRVSRIVPPKVVGGRIVPEMWNPKTYLERYELRNEFVEALLESINMLTKEKYHKIIIYLINEIPALSYTGQAKKIIDFLIFNKNLNKDELILLRKKLNECLSNMKFIEANNKDIECFREYLNIIKPKNLQEEFESFIALDYWQLNRKSEEKCNDIIGDFAKKLIDNKFDLNFYTKTFSDKSKNSTMINYLIRKIGENDLEFYYYSYIEELIETNLCEHIASNYILGNSISMGKINNKFLVLFDKYMYEYRDTILYFTLVLDASAYGYSRAVKIIKKGIENYSLLYNFQYLEWESFLSEDNKLELLQIILSCVPSEYSYKIILHLNYMWNNKSIGENRQKLIVSVLKKINIQKSKIDVWEWKENFEIISEKYINDKIDILVETFKECSDLNTEEYCISLFMKLGKKYSHLIMNGLGEIFLKKDNIRKFISVYTGLFDSLNFEVVKTWIQEHGENAAIAIARHLSSPEPKVDNPIYIPRLTEFVLTEFEESDRVFREFLCGRHSFKVFCVDERIAEHDSLVIKMQPYLEHTNKRIREWAQYEMDESENLIINTEEHRILRERDN